MCHISTALSPSRHSAPQTPPIGQLCRRLTSHCSSIPPAQSGDSRGDGAVGWRHSRGGEGGWGDVGRKERWCEQEGDSGGADGMGPCTEQRVGSGGAEHTGGTEGGPEPPSTATGPPWHRGGFGKSRRPHSPAVTPLPLPAAAALRVDQRPAELRVVVGANASLPCQLVPARPWSVVRIAWLKDGGSGALCTTRLRPEAAAVPCATPYLQLAWSPPHANLSLRGAQEGHAGCYVCHVTVEVPYLATAAGNGTALHVGAGTPGGARGWAAPRSAAPPPQPPAAFCGVCGTPGAVPGDAGCRMAAHPGVRGGRRRGWGRRGPDRAFPLLQELMERTGQVCAPPRPPTAPHPPLPVAMRRWPIRLCLQSCRGSWGGPRGALCCSSR